MTEPAGPIDPATPATPAEPAEPVGAVEPGRELVPLPKAPAPKPPAPGLGDLVTRTARVGIGAVGLVAGDVASASVRFARAVLPPAIAERPLDAVGGEVDRRLDAARQREEVHREEALEAVHVVVNKVLGAAVDQVDMPALVERIPIDEMLESVDLGSIIRDSTSGLVAETTDAIRVQSMGLDLWLARVVDKVLRRKEPRDLVLAGYDVTGPETRTPKAMG